MNTVLICNGVGYLVGRGGSGRTLLQKGLCNVVFIA